MAGSQRAPEACLPAFFLGLAGPALPRGSRGAEEAELGALCANAREGTIFRQALRGMGYPQAPAPATANAATARAMLGSGAPGRCLKGAGMRLHWMKGRAKRNIFNIQWKAAEANLGHYPTMKHEPTHHRKVRPICTHRDGESPAALQGCASILGGLRATRRPTAKPAGKIPP